MYAGSQKEGFTTFPGKEKNLLKLPQGIHQKPSHFNDKKPNLKVKFNLAATPTNISTQLLKFLDHHFDRFLAQS